MVDILTMVGKVNISQNKNEKVINYMMGWCKLSSKCEHPLDQVQAVVSLVRISII